MTENGLQSIRICCWIRIFSLCRGGSMFPGLSRKEWLLRFQNVKDSFDNLSLNDPKAGNNNLKNTPEKTEV